MNFGDGDVVETVVISSKDICTRFGGICRCLREEPRTKSSRQCLGIGKLWCIPQAASEVALIRVFAKRWRTGMSSMLLCTDRFVRFEPFLACRIFHLISIRPLYPPHLAFLRLQLRAATAWKLAGLEVVQLVCPSSSVTLHSSRGGRRCIKRRAFCSHQRCVGTCIGQSQLSGQLRVGRFCAAVRQFRIFDRTDTSRYLTIEH